MIIMRKLFSPAVLSVFVLLSSASTVAVANEFHFGVIANSSKIKPDEAALKRAIAQSNDANLAFVVVNGVKSSIEACSDQIYMQRKELLNSAENGVIVSLAASDWSDCKNSSGKPNAIERLSRVRDLFFSDEFSLGASKIPLTRLSSTAKFRGYGENARWEFDDILFATINLPASNNRFRAEAGRNSEFEDRLVANRHWLNRIFAFAKRKPYRGIVLFSDGNPALTANAMRNVAANGKRDGFAEIRQQITSLSGKFPGKVLFIDDQIRPNNNGGGKAIADDQGSRLENGAADGIVWRGNLGHLSVVSGWLELIVNPVGATMFSIRNGAVSEKSTAE